MSVAVSVPFAIVYYHDLTADKTSKHRLTLVRRLSLYIFIGLIFHMCALYWQLHFFFLFVDEA